MLTSLLRLRLIVGLLAMLFIATLAMPAGTAMAAGESQLRVVGGESCSVRNVIIDTESNCVPLKFSVVSITGVNQRGEKVTWKNPHCEALSTFEVPNWWWDFKKEVIIEVSAAQQTQKLRVQGSRLGGQSWVVLTINHKILNNKDMGLSASANNSKK
ncbi:MAG: hypothetical protein HGA45_21830 [Chloroflexales bacterium]|nr:hypothetical protein [Chloroflexales bacterium]